MSTIELQPDQQKALDNSELLRAVDPRTNATYVLVREEFYDRLKQLAYDDSPWTLEEMDRLAWEAGELAGWDEMDEYDNYPVKS